LTVDRDETPVEDFPYRTLEPGWTAGIGAAKDPAIRTLAFLARRCGFPHLETSMRTLAS